MINSVSTKLSFFIFLTKSMFIELCLILIIFLLFLFTIIIVKCMNIVFSLLIFISKSNRIFIDCLITLVGIICYALCQLIKSFIKDKASNRSNHALLKDPILDLFENNEIAAFSHQSPLNKWIGDIDAISHMTDKLDLFVDDSISNKIEKRKVIVEER